MNGKWWNRVCLMGFAASLGMAPLCSTAIAKHEGRRASHPGDMRGRHGWNRGELRGNVMIGDVVRTLPGGYVTILHGKKHYHYHKGVFYVPSNGRYVVVEPPVGAVVPVYPPGARVVVFEGRTYYDDGGVFYIPRGRGFVVVVPPQ